MPSESIKKIVADFLPDAMRHWIERQKRRFSCWPPLGFVRFGSFRRLKPISRVFGLDRGLCIDRYYIKRFLAAQASSIKGSVLEIGDDTYTREFGGNRVTRSDVLHLEQGNPKATIFADLTRAEHISSETFDCIICTQTLQLIVDVKTAIKTLHRILKPAGVLLATFPGISQISRYDMDRWGDYWRFTDASAQRLFGEIFGCANVDIASVGNVLVACAFLHGLTVNELKQEELNHHDPDYQLLITARAVKGQEGSE